MSQETTITPLAIITHEAVRGFRRERSLESARALIKAYFRLLGSIGGDGVAYELSGQELDAVHQAATMTHRPVQVQGSAVTA